MKKKVLAAMSGGVDSSVAAFLLKSEGYDVTGVTMCFGMDGGGEARCCGVDAVSDARRVCDKLKIPHYSFDYAAELEEKIIGKFVAEYRQGRTPNPCIDCNRSLKFDSLFKKAAALGFDFLATGHYAGIDEEDGGFFLKRPRDRHKDQTYFLYAMPLESLPRVLFPLADLTKEEVRNLARKAELPVAEKGESQDLCFVGRQDCGAFVAARIGGAKPGPIVNRDGIQLGVHRGIVFYTVGQRSGLGIAHPVPLYVLAVEAAKNRIVVGEKEDLKARSLRADDLNVLVDPWPVEVTAKIRYRRKAAPCEVFREEGGIRVLFREAEEAITPGQAIVFYNGDYVLGGATIIAHGPWLMAHG